MSKWKLTRQIFGSEQYMLTEGDIVTIGRGICNVVTLASNVISRNHCVINVQQNKALITDLQSSNGVYVGTVKIPPNKPYVIEDSDVIGLGWTSGAPLVNIEDSEKYIFKLSKEKTPPLTNRIRFVSDNEVDDIESEIAKFDECENKKENKSPLLCTKLSLKRKIDNVKIKEEPMNEICCNGSIINISDSDHDGYVTPVEIGTKKPKLQAITEELKQSVKESNVKNENEFVEYDAFTVKQEYIGYDDEPIKIDSESDSDSESEQWLLRLSQNSPGKPFTKLSKSIKAEIKPEDGSYSQLDDHFVCNNSIFEDDEEFAEDIISIPEPEEKSDDVLEKNRTDQPQHEASDGGDGFSDDIISIPKLSTPIVTSEKECEISRDEIDGFGTDILSKPIESGKPHLNEILKKTKMIEPLAKSPKGKSRRITMDNLAKKSLSSKYNTSKVDPKKHISTSQKEERKKRLAELAVKDKDESRNSRDSPTATKKVTNVKVTSSNRGAFLTDTAQAVVKPVKRKEDSNKIKQIISESPKHTKAKSKEQTENLDKRKKDCEKDKSYKEKSKESKHKEEDSTANKQHKASKKPDSDNRVPLKSLRPLADSKESLSGKPVSKVGPMPPEKHKKKVRFSEAAPQIREFEIEPGNKMKKTSLVKTTLVDIRQKPVFSLEKITLMKILRWNPQWLEEQLNTNDPPPILGHNNTPLALFHSFVNHNQYVQLVGDLLLMEIWECLTIAYMKIRNQTGGGFQMTVESLPPMPSQERCFDLFNLCVNVSIHPSETRNLPRVGEIMLISFGPENAVNRRFFFVNNIRQMPAAPGQTRHFYSISLHATVTEKIMLLKPGEIIRGKSLAYINNELMLFEAMEYLAGSPLSEAILKPEPRHFIWSYPCQLFNINSPWTMTLNPSQIKAVHSSVAAALSDRPSIQMVQGPPGTGKSSVICAIVMTYFYNAQGKKEQNRGKILICATSNAAVDGLVIRLLNLRQSLPKPERFRMVRVGRAEKMHAVAADVSSQQLAARDLARPPDAPPRARGLDEEILHLEAKVNMWKSAAENAKDPVRIAYCQGRANEVVKRIALLRSGGGGGGELRPEQLAAAERRIIEGADIVVTTLASAQNHKMRGLKRRIALCIIDEAGQVIEPETLIPLTLDVTRLTLIGDPQQLPGYICSQRAKKHGLSESLFSRLTSSTDEWTEGNPVVLLNQQYRMHPEIADYPSRAFYGGMVQTVAPTRPDIQIPPYCIIGISSGDKGQGASGANELEAWGVARLVAALGAGLPRALGLAVVTPYNAHKDLVKRHLKALQIHRDAHVEVNTVDSFQGQERDVVVVSLARSAGLGFLCEPGRMNVMLTRARHALFVCLNPHALVKNPQWRTLVEDSQRRNLYKSLPNRMCQPITAAQVANDDILKYIINQKSTNTSHR